MIVCNSKISSGLCFLSMVSAYAETILYYKFIQKGNDKGYMKEKRLTVIKKDIKRNWVLYLLVLPVIAYYILFHYKPMYGALIAFQDYRPARGFGEDWVGLKHFIKFFDNPYFGRLIKNTLLISLYDLFWGFPAPIILALLFNEVKSKKFKTITQTFMYLPHFVSIVVICGMLVQFSLTTGLFNDIAVMLGGERTPLLQRPELYRTIYVASGVWKSFGWESIIYVAALAGVDTQLYDAAKVDGAGKWKQMLHVTLPGIMPTIVIKLILRIGSMMSLGYEKTLLLYNEATYETADIIASYVYRQGLVNKDYSYAAAVDIFNSAVNIILVVTANRVSKKVSETSLW